MDKDLIWAKLESLRKCLRRIEEKRPPSPEILKADLDLQDIISVNLERAIQQSVDIALIVLADSEITPPSTMALSFEALCDHGVINKELAQNLRKAVGFRNIAVHEYNKIDWDIVYSIITDHITDFRQLMNAVIKFFNL